MSNLENSNFIPISSIQQVSDFGIEVTPMDYGAESATRNLYTGRNESGHNLFEIYYFTKRFKFDSEEEYLRLHTAARQAHLPVLDIYSVGEDSYAMPDITAYGSVILDRHFLDELTKVDPKEVSIPEDLIRRANIVSANQDSILGGLEQMVVEIYQNANSGGVTLPFDNGLCIWLRSSSEAGSVKFTPQPLLLDFSFLITTSAYYKQNAHQVAAFGATIKGIVKKCTRLARPLP